MARKPLSTKIENDLQKKIKKLAIDQERPLNDLLEEAIQDILKKYEKKQSSLLFSKREETNMQCQKCNTEMVCKEGTHHYKESGLDNVYLKGIEIYTCKCGERVISIPSVPELHTILGRFLIKKNSLLNGKEIRFLRKNMGLTATKLVDYIGVDIATISRWENEKHPITKPHDLLLRIVYSNIKEIPTEEIKQIIKDEFKKIQAKHKKISRHYITPEQWSKSDPACATA